MSQRVELVELQQWLSRGGSAQAVLLDFDVEHNEWRERNAPSIEVHESAGVCCFDNGARLWVLECEQSRRWEVLGITWEAGLAPKLATHSEMKS